MNFCRRHGKISLEGGSCLANSNSRGNFLESQDALKVNTPVYKRPILGTKKHMAKIICFGHFFLRLSRNDHSRVISKAHFCWVHRIDLFLHLFSNENPYTRVYIPVLTGGLIDKICESWIFIRK